MLESTKVEYIYQRQFWLKVKMENIEGRKLEEVLEEHGEHKEPESSLQHIVQRP